MMITLYDACSIAYDYFRNNLNGSGLAEARETENCYIFGAGKSNTINIGGAVICVRKTDGEVSVLRFPSKESSTLYNSSHSVSIPGEFSGK